MYARIRNKYSTILAVGRQFMHLVNQHGSIPAGIEALKKIGSDEQQVIIKSLERAFTDESSNEDDILEPKIGPYGILQKLIVLIKSEGGDPVTIFPGFDKMLFNINDQMRALWVSIGGFLLYVAFVLFVAASVFTVMLVFVFPQFESMFLGFGGKLPALTALFIENDAIIFFGMFLGLVTLLITMIATVFHIFNQTGQLRPLSRKLSMAPFMKKVVYSYNRLLALNYIRLLITAGISPDKAIVLGAQIACDNDMHEYFSESPKKSGQKDSILSAIHIANDAGNLESELDYQINDQNYQLATDFMKARQEAMFVGHIILAVFVGMTVAAMYLPIFKMGEVA